MYGVEPTTGSRYTDLDASHLKLVVHVVDSETSLVDEVVQSSVLLNKQLLCTQNHEIVSLQSDTHWAGSSPTTLGHRSGGLA